LAAAARARGQRPRAHIRPRRRDEAPNPKATVNTTDPDSQFVRGNGRTLQGYNAQAAVSTAQVVVAAELTQQANDLQQLAPMLCAIRTTLTSAGIDARPHRLAADSGYWSIANVSAIPGAPELLIPPARHGRHGKPRKDGKPSESKSDTLRAATLARLSSEQGKACYAQRSRTIEPVFGQVKTVQGGGGSCAAAYGHTRPNGSRCAAPTTCSSSGARPRPPAADRHHPPCTAPRDRTHQPHRRQNHPAGQLALPGEARSVQQAPTR
jgi:Transposase DDE domain